MILLYQLKCQNRNYGNSQRESCMSKKKSKPNSSTPKKKSPIKKNCNKKCSKKKCTDPSPTLKNEEVIIKPKSKMNYLLGLIKKTFGYDSDA